jgi:hypothetical protein
MIDHNLGLETDGGIVAFHVVPQILVRAADIELRIAFDGFDELV